MSTAYRIRKQIELKGTRFKTPSEVNNIESTLDTGFITVKKYIKQEVNKDSSGIRQSKLRSLEITDKDSRQILNLPLLHRSHKLLIKPTCSSSYVEKDTGITERQKSLQPLIIQALRTPDTRNLISAFNDTISSIEVTFQRSEMKSAAKEKPVSEPPSEYHEILPFPAVEDGEIDKHKHLNEEAEKNSKKKNPEVHPDYLKRLKLERKALAEKTRELKLAKKKMLMQKRAAKAKIKEIRDEFLIPDPLPPPPPPKPKDTEPKPVKTILGFRYSQAIEEYYRGKLKPIGSFVTLLNDVEDDMKDEVVNGWFVRTLGANVLNLHAKTLPSCNPVEIRLRRQARLRNRDNSRSLLSIHRSFSRDSVASQAMFRSHDSYGKLKTIEEGRISRHSNISPGSSGEDKPEVTFRTESRSPNGPSSPVRLPSLYTHTTEELCGVARSPTKSITMILPQIISEEG